MTEVPDDASSRVFKSLANALAANEIPVGNHALINKFCEYIGIDRYEDRGYIKAVRADGGPALQIHYGWTNGFQSEAEVLAAVGEAPFWPSERGTGLWGVSHPVNNLDHGGGGPAKHLREYGTCPKHFLKLPATGICGECS